jgi:tRNA-dihydrouridine synthase C
VRIYFAPMEGVVDHPLRQVYAQMGGMDMFVTEFIRVTTTELPDKLFKRYCPELIQPLNIPVRVQLLGSEPDTLAMNAAIAARLGAPGIDLNFGCPAKTVNQHRGGACLLQEPELLYDIARQVRLAVPTSIPVTAKMRLGYLTRSGYIENALALAEGGISELVVHGRSKTDGYAPPAYWDAIGEIKAALKIRVIANGDIWSLDDYIRCHQESGCEDVMLGRGLLAKPDLARIIKAAYHQQMYTPLTWAQILPIVRNFHIENTANNPPQFCGNRLKQWLSYLRREYPQAQILFERVKKLREPEAILNALQNN